MITEGMLITDPNEAIMELHAKQCSRDGFIMGHRRLHRMFHHGVDVRAGFGVVPDMQIMRIMQCMGQVDGAGCKNNQR